MNKIAVVTGGSGGIGRCTAASLKAAGCTVYEISRRDIPSDGIIHMSADVTDEAQVRRVIDEIAAREGRIDILVNNAGFGISGAAELTESRETSCSVEAPPNSTATVNFSCDIRTKPLSETAK